MKFLRLLLVPLALLCVLILRLLKGRVRIGVLQANRIGHLAGNVEVYLCERDAGLHKGIDIWCVPGDVCNEQLLKMWRRVITIDRTGFTKIVLKVNQLFNNPEIIEIPSGNIDRDVNNLLEKYPSHLRFTEAEENRGQQELQRMGIPEGAKWVCLIVRDSAYLPDFSYHSYRDSDIFNYMEAVQKLVDHGYYVIRMGAKVMKPMPFYCKFIIDYATNGMRSEFMDIYLAAKCEFAISTSTGLDAVCTAFRRPICYVNFVPLEYLPTWSNSLAIWKHHEKEDKRGHEIDSVAYPGYEVLNITPRKRMTPKEIFESGAGQFMRADQFEEAGITLVDNTPEEIRDVAIEMASVVEGKMVYHKYWSTETTESYRNQDDFWISFPRSMSEYTKTPLHGEIRMRIGREFLEGYLNEEIDSFVVGENK